MYNINHYKKIAFQSLIASTTIMALCTSTFMLAEPTISHGQQRDTDKVFTIKQTIIDETSFLVPPANVTMNGSINGVTGGTATGTSQFSVISSNASGYYVNIAFQYVANTEAMVGDENASQAIRDYGAGKTTPTYGITASSAAQFAYTVVSSTTADTAAVFRSSGAVCGSGAVNGLCWKAPSSTAYQIVNRTTAATTGATSSVVFNVTVPSNASPIPEAQTYTATATLTLYIQ